MNWEEKLQLDDNTEQEIKDFWSTHEAMPPETIREFTNVITPMIRENKVIITCIDYLKKTAYLSAGDWSFLVKLREKFGLIVYDRIYSVTSPIGDTKYLGHPNYPSCAEAYLKLTVWTKLMDIIRIAVRYQRYGD